jgi:hypothetical protein
MEWFYRIRKSQSYIRADFLGGLNLRNCLHSSRQIRISSLNSNPDTIVFAAVVTTVYNPWFAFQCI